MIDESSSSEKGRDESAGAPDPVSEWLNSSTAADRQKALSKSKRVAMQKALARYQELAKEGGARDLHETYLRLLAGKEPDEPPLPAETPPPAPPPSSAEENK